MLSVFADESTDATQSRVFAVAGVVGREPDWRTTEARWLERTGGRIFHATDCAHEGDDDLYEDLTRIVAESKLGARGVALDLMAFKEIFPHLTAETGYYKCFVMVVSWHTENAERLGEEIEFTFDRRARSEYNTSRLYGAMASKPDWDARSLMKSKISFESPKHNPRLQIADLVARETMKCLDNQLRGLERRDELNTLIKDRRVSIGVLDRKYCLGWRAAVDHANEGGEDASAKTYMAWLGKNKRIDNMSNRIAFIDWLQSRK